jgi:hypothetical protein
VLLFAFIAIALFFPNRTLMTILHLTSDPERKKTDKGAGNLSRRRGSNALAGVGLAASSQAICRAGVGVAACLLLFVEQKTS